MRKLKYFFILRKSAVLLVYRAPTKLEKGSVTKMRSQKGQTPDPEERSHQLSKELCFIQQQPLVLLGDAAPP